MQLSGMGQHSRCISYPLPLPHRIYSLNFLLQFCLTCRPSSFGTQSCSNSTAMAVQQALTPAFEQFFNFERDAGTETPPLQGSPVPDLQDVETSNVDPMLEGGLYPSSNLPQQPGTLPLESSLPPSTPGQMHLNWLCSKSTPLSNGAIPPYTLEAQPDSWLFDVDSQSQTPPRPEKQGIENASPLRISRSEFRGKQSKQRNTVMVDPSKQDQRLKQKTHRKQKNIDPNNPAEAEKRSKFLECNRIAAAKMPPEKKRMGKRSQ